MNEDKYIVWVEDEDTCSSGIVFDEFGDRPFCGSLIDAAALQATMLSRYPSSEYVVYKLERVK